MITLSQISLGNDGLINETNTSKKHSFQEYTNIKRKSDNNFKVAIIGSGDVVLKKTLPALQRVVDAKQISVYTLSDIESIPDYEKNGTPFYKIINVNDELINDISKSQIVWISSPSDTHMLYLKRLINFDIYIVIEKPITVIENELNDLNEIIQGRCREKVFFLSYYTLEKALPLIYLVRPSPLYKKYLNISDDEFSKVYSQLGLLKSINIYIIEGKDDRKWVYSNGGHYFETFIHNILIASHFVETPQKNWKELQICEGNFYVEKGIKSPNAINLRATTKMNQSIHLFMVKNIDDKTKICRGAYINYQNGEIHADFSEQKAIMKCYSTNKVVTIEIIPEFQDKKYDIQVDLAINCFHNQTKTNFEVDGLCYQTDIIKWLLSIIKDENKETIDSSRVDEYINKIKNINNDYYKIKHI